MDIAQDINAPDGHLIIAATTACWQTVHKKWIHQHWVHASFNDESMNSVYRPLWLSRPRIQTVSWIQQSFVFHQHDEKLGHDRYSCWGWLCAHHRKSPETNAGGSSSGAIVPTCGDSGDGRESVWGISLNVLTDIPMLSNISEPFWQINNVQFIWLAPSWSWTLGVNFRLLMQRRARSSIDVIVFNRCSRSPWARLLLSQTRCMIFRCHFVAL